VGGRVGVNEGLYVTRLSSFAESFAAASTTSWALEPLLLPAGIGAIAAAATT
jgi:hypothetical protein